MNKKEWFSPHDPARRIGSLTEVSATEARVNLTKAGSGEQSWLLGNRVAIGEVNQYVFIDTGEYTILGKLIKVWLEGSERLSVDNIDDHIPNNTPMGLVQLLTSLNTVTGYNFRGIKQYPKLGAQIYSAHPELVAILAKGTLNITLNDIELEIAELPNDSSMGISVTPEKLFARHCAVLGATGGGKSYTIANLIENIDKHGGKVLLIDPTGEYGELPAKSYYVGNHSSAEPDEQATYPHWMFTDSDLFALLRPSVQTQAPKLRSAIQSLKIVEHIKKYPTTGIKIANGTLIKANQDKEIIDQVLLNTYSDSSLGWDFSKLASQIDAECVWYPKSDSKYGSRNDNEAGYCTSLIFRIEAMVKNENLKWMINCDSNIKTIPNIIEEFMNSKDHILRLDLSAVPFEANAREILVNTIGRKLLSLARKGTITSDNPLIVFIDEAHQFLNKKIGDEVSRIELDAFGNIAKEGRKYGLNVVIATQRPRDIPEDVLSQVGTLIVHRLSNQHDQEIVKKAVGSIDNRSAAFLPVLGQGEALLLGVDFPFPMVIKMKKPHKEPSSRSTSFSNAWKRRLQ